MEKQKQRYLKALQGLPWWSRVKTVLPVQGDASSILGGRAWIPHAMELLSPHIEPEYHNERAQAHKEDPAQPKKKSTHTHTHTHTHKDIPSEFGVTLNKMS